MLLSVIALTAVICSPAWAQIQVLDPNSLSNSTASLSAACVTALEATINCNSGLVPIAASGNFYSVNDDVYTSLCTTACSSSLASYHDNVVSACGSTPQAFTGYPNTYWGDVYWATYNLSCLADPTTGASCMGQYPS